MGVCALVIEGGVMNSGLKFRQVVPVGGFVGDVRAVGEDRGTESGWIVEPLVADKCAIFTDDE